jgi:hypothetical protein
VNVPVPLPSDPTGKVRVPVKVVPLLEIVNVAVRSTFDSSLSTVIPVTVTVIELPGPAVAGERVIVLGVRLNAPDADVPTKLPESVAVTVTASLTATANASRVGMRPA